MKRFNLLLLIAMLLCCTSNYSQAQEKCGTDALFEDQLKKLGSTRKQYARQFNSIIKNLDRRIKQGERSLQDKVYKIPVVVHILHYVRNGFNIDDDAVHEQIQLLNEHFKETHDGVSDIPEEYQDVRAGNVGIEFYLAEIDPFDLPTTGITRTEIETNRSIGPRNYWDFEGGGSGWGQQHRSLWPTSQYFNIFVVPSPSAGYGGVAVLPSFNVPGLAVGVTHPSDLGLNIRSPGRFDGVCINVNVFATRNTNPSARSSSEGKVTSHEAGHYLGLFHTFGGSQGDCDPGDYCDDTPPTQRPASGCRASRSCGRAIPMHENIMDYSADECLLLFTACQRKRMRTAMELCPRRVSLLEEDKLAVPEKQNDLGILGFASGFWNECEGVFEGRVVIANYGTNPITSAELLVSLNDDEVHRITTLPRAIPSYDTVSIQLSEIPYQKGTGQQDVRAVVVSVNGGEDSNNANDSTRFSIVSPPEATDMNDIEEQFLLYEQSNELFEMVSDNNGGEMLSIKMLDSPKETFGDRIIVVGPEINFSQFSDDEAVTLSFRYSLRERYDLSMTEVYVFVAGCEDDDLSINYYNAGMDLNTAPYRLLDEEPQFDHEWRSIRVPLARKDIKGSVYMLIYNGGAGNLYIDDMDISSSTPISPDLGIVEISLPEVYCGFPGADAEIEMMYLFTNYSIGVEDTGIASVGVRTNIDDDSEVIGGPSVYIPGGRPTLDDQDFPSLWVIVGFEVFSRPLYSTLELELVLNAGDDEDLENNFQTKSFINLPIRNTELPITDEGDSSGDWEEVDTGVPNAPDWERVNGFIKAPFYIHNEVYLAKLVSPWVDLENETEASISFDVAYAKNGDKADRLQLFVFEDCIPIPAAVLYDKADEDLAVTNSNTDWEPSSDSDWREEIINISEYAGKKGYLHFMFVATSNGGNNIYLDNIRIEATGRGVARPTILSFSPAEGAVSTAVTITGESFSETPSENTVRFGSVMAAEPTSASTTSLTVVVPDGAVTGRISVAVGGQTGTSSTDFTVTGTTPAPDPLVVSSFSPAEGAVGTSVTITGENFSETPSENTVRFGSVMAAAPTSASTTSLTVAVPDHAVTGRISVIVGGQTATSSINFTVPGTTPVSPFSVLMEKALRAYPNPASRRIRFANLSADRSYTYKIYSLVGHQVAEGMLQGDNSVELGSFPAGQYILVLQTKVGQEAFRTRLLVLE